MRTLKMEVLQGKAEIEGEGEGEGEGEKAQHCRQK